MTNLFDLTGKTAIVTGGGSGIGKAIATGLASAGANIAIAARNMDKISAAISDIHEEYPQSEIIGVEVDVRDEKKIRNMVKAVSAEFGHIDILVNNAGINRRKMPQDYKVEEWDEVLDTNLRGAFLCCQAVFPSMKAAGGGKIINIGSMTSILGGAMLAPYGTSKGGILQLTRSLSVAWALDNIQVNAILPGFINTELTGQAKKDMPDLEEHVANRTPVKRWGEPQELAGTAIFLASAASDFVTGVGLPVDGGYSIMI